MKGAVLLAIPVVALALASPTHADSPCTALANNESAFNACVQTAQAHCTSGMMIYFWHHVTCTYPNGGRDECDVQHPLAGDETANCTYSPPGAP